MVIEEKTGKPKNRLPVYEFHKVGNYQFLNNLADKI